MYSGQAEFLSRCGWPYRVRHLQNCPSSSLSCKPILPGIVCTAPAPLQSTLQCVRFPSSIPGHAYMFTLLSGGEECPLEGFRGDFRGVSEAILEKDSCPTKSCLLAIHQGIHALKRSTCVSQI